MSKSKNNNAEGKIDKSGNLLYQFYFCMWLLTVYFNFIFSLEAYLLAEKNEEIKMLNSIILGLHKKLSAVMETDVSDFEM